ncbi:hypothetical protein RB195_003131 [Necator americanus]|uniref:Reverse transcriptase domain-containing protein n=1 Tax=Necator americanus TaxID=51031 RepID=A0ABR1DM70_NECAM
MKDSYESKQGFENRFSTIDHMHTVSKLIEVSREYKIPLWFTFIDLKKAFDTVETEAVEALDNQGASTPYIKILRELYTKMFVRNGLVSDAPFTPNGTNISDISSYAYLGREINMMT